jgi:hypothetical protein
MGSSRKKEVLRRLAGVSSVSEDLFAALRQEFALSEGTLRRYVRESGLELAPLVEGVRQDSLENLERTLGRLADLYWERAKDCREMVLEAKRHAAFQKRQEVLLYLNTWLENPAVFRSWADLRRKKTKGPSSSELGPLG